MSLSKRKVYDKIETVRVKDHYVLQIREAIQIIESGNVISENYHRSVLQPDADVSTITDPVVLAQFNAVMTDQIKQNYQAFLSSKQQEVTGESSE